MLSQVEDHELYSVAAAIIGLSLIATWRELRSPRGRRSAWALTALPFFILALICFGSFARRWFQAPAIDSGSSSANVQTTVDAGHESASIVSLKDTDPEQFAKNVARWETANRFAITAAGSGPNEPLDVTVTAALYDRDTMHEWAFVYQLVELRLGNEQYDLKEVGRILIFDFLPRWRNVWDSDKGWEPPEQLKFESVIHRAAPITQLAGGMINIGCTIECRVWDKGLNGASDKVVAEFRQEVTGQTVLPVSKNADIHLHVDINDPLNPTAAGEF